MASVIKIHLICDGCEAPYGLQHQDRTATEQREMARADGWAYHKNKDLCPGCRAPRRLPKTPRGDNPYAHF